MGDEQDTLKGDLPSGGLSKIEDIIRFDQQVWEITKGFPIRTGSILRVPSSSYLRWNINLTADNESELAELAEKFRLKDYREREADQSISEDERTTFSRSARGRMVRVTGYTVTEILKSLDDGQRRFNLLDIAAGLGQTSSAIAAALRADETGSDILNRTAFHLVDYSGDKLHRAKSALGNFKPAAIWTYPMNDEDFLFGTTERFEIAVSTCHFHKKPFNYVFEAINSALSDDGALVSGDWHSSLGEHPLYIYQLLERIGVEPSKLDRFRELFGDLLDPFSKPSLSEEETKAVIDHQDHWIEIHRNTLDNQASKMRNRRHYVLGAFDTTKKRIEKLESAGFKTDPETLSKAFPGASLIVNPKPMTGISDRASVIAAAKMAR